MKLVVGIIATNEKKMLFKNLPDISKAFNKEVLCIDYESTDNFSKVIMQEYSRLTVTMKWPRHFGEAKNNLIKMAEGFGYDWILILDADESLELDKVKMMKECIESNNHTLYYLPRLGFNTDNLIEGDIKSFPDLQSRLFKLNEGYHYQEATHCQLCNNENKNVYEQNIGAILPIYIYHYVGMKPKEVLMLREMERDAISKGLPPVKSIGDIQIPENKFKLSKPLIINLK